MARELTDRERIFALAYVCSPTLNVTEAAREAGYADTTGRDLMQRPHIRELIDQLLATRAERHAVTADLVISRLWEVIDAAQVGGDFKAAVSGLKLLMQHLGMFPKDDGVLALPGGGSTMIQINIGRDQGDADIQSEVVAGRAIIHAPPKIVPRRPHRARELQVPAEQSRAGSGDSVRPVRGSGVRGEVLWPEDGDA